MSENLARILTETAERSGDHTAFKLDDVELTYAMLDGAAARIAHLLEDKGLQPGDRVGLMLPNAPEFAAIYYAVIQAGAVVVPMNPLLKAREVSITSATRARLIFAGTDFAGGGGPGGVTGTEPTTIVDRRSIS